MTDDDVNGVVVTLEETRAEVTHWPTRSMAKETGMSQSAVSRIRRDFGSNRIWARCSLSPDPFFIEKVRDVVGLYITHPMLLWFSASIRASIGLPQFSPYGQDYPNGAPTTM
jgi:hypothetical protein